MRLHSAHITNFKLLEDIHLQFSTESARPLTVIRAENGSGKTSILQALRWAMWGEEGIPLGMPLTSSAVPVGQPITVQVSVDFIESDMFSGEETRYRLIRTCEETRGGGDNYQRDKSTDRLLMLTDHGSVDIEEGRKAQINAMLPLSLADIFFTDGDAVQNFVSGIDQSQRDRQEYVHQAIRQLLGFDDLESAQTILTTISRRFRRDLRSSGSAKLREAEQRREEVEKSLGTKEEERVRVRHRIKQVDEQIRKDEREYDRFRGIGDLDEIQSRIHQLNSDIEHLNDEEVRVRRQMKELLQSEGLSRRMLMKWLQSGIDVLEELEDKNVIPGMSVNLLYDRLQLGICICGIDLTRGDPRHTHILDLIDQQKRTEPRLQRLTELRYESRDLSQEAPRTSDSNELSTARLQSLRKQFIDCKDRQRKKNGDLKVEDDRRRQIDEDRVRELSQRLDSGRTKKSEYERQLGQIERRIQELEEQLKKQQDAVNKAERQEELSNALTFRTAVANDLLALTKGILDRLKTDHVRRVSTRMEQLFLDIVGADPNAESRLYSGVNIVNGTYDVEVHTLEDRTLDVVTELNGASKRVLTLSLIWALMEVAEKEAPRIIDSPLGMTSGATKYRMVDLLTLPTNHIGLPYQVILFMTRSEIRDIEQLIQERASVITTLTCSKDYPIDLVNDWGTSYPVVRTCPCDHTQICRLCERRNDRGRFKYREALN